MRDYVIAIIIIVLLIVAIIVIKKNKQNQIEGLGKIASKNRPPKLRIVYSKKQNIKDRKKVTSSGEVYKVLQEIWSKQIDAREEMIMLLLDRSNHVLGYHVLSMGGITGTVADLRLLFAVALKSLATSVILTHNHPSGSLTPSQADITLTKKIKEAGKIMDIQLLDHLIMTKTEYYSFADEGVL